MDDRTYIAVMLTKTEWNLIVDAVRASRDGLNRFENGMGDHYDKPLMALEVQLEPDTILAA